MLKSFSHRLRRPLRRSLPKRIVQPRRDDLTLWLLVRTVKSFNHNAGRNQSANAAVRFASYDVQCGETPIDVRPGVGNPVPPVAADACVDRAVA